MNAFVSPRQQLCELYGSTIRHISDVEIPATETKIAMLESLLAYLQAQGLQGSELQPTLSALEKANSDLDDANGQLTAFTQEFEFLGCSSAGDAPDGEQRA